MSMRLGQWLDEFGVHEEVWVARSGEVTYEDDDARVIHFGVYITLVDAADLSVARLEFLKQHGFDSEASSWTSPSFELIYGDAVRLMTVLDAWLVVKAATK